jgi:hypothetical protein
MIQQLKAESNESSVVFGLEIPTNQTVNYALAMQIIEKDNAIIQKLKLNNRIDEASLISENENYKAITLSQEKDIQKLKNALAQKTQEIKTLQFASWQDESAILIFSVGMLIFAFLYIRTKVNIKFPDSLLLSPLISQEK